MWLTMMLRKAQLITGGLNIETLFFPLTNNIQINASWLPPEQVISVLQGNLKQLRVILPDPVDLHRAVSIYNSAKQGRPPLKISAHLFFVLGVKSSAPERKKRAPTSEPQPHIHPLSPPPERMKSSRSERAGNHHTGAHQSMDSVRDGGLGRDRLDPRPKGLLKWRRQNDWANNI